MQENEFEYYRYPGPRPFHDTYRDRRLFFGRDPEKLALLQTVLANNLAVLHGPSGTGKTSLIHAGITRELRLRNYLPVTIRYAPTGPDLVPLIYKRIAATAAQHHLYHDPGEETTLWQYFKTLALRGPDNIPLNPFLILDQFEDFLLYTTTEHRRNAFQQLADLVNNTVPQALRETIKPGTPLLYNMMPPGVKIIAAIQEETLSHLEEYSRDFPGLFANRLALAGLNREQAQHAIVKPAALEDDTLGPSPCRYAPETVDMMLNFLCEAKEAAGFTIIDEAEPFALQLLCRAGEENAREKAKKGETGIIGHIAHIIQPGDLGGEKGMKKTLHGFYDRQLRRVGSGPARRKARRLCEKGLVRGGKRITLGIDRIEDQYNPPADMLPGLAAAGLVQTGANGEDTYYELGHDKLVPYIKAASLKNQVRQITAAGVIIICILLLVGISAKVTHTRARVPTRRVVLAEHVKYGNIHMRRGEYAEAEQRFLAGVKLSPGYAPVYNALGIALVKQGKFGDAMAAYRKALELSPQFNSAMANLAEAALIASDFPAAYKQAQEVIKQPKIHPDINLPMRLISIAALLYQGKEQEAVKQVKAFLLFYKGLPGRYARIWNYGDINRFQDFKQKLPAGQMQVLLQVLDILQDTREGGILKIEKLESLVARVFAKGK